MLSTSIGNISKSCALDAAAAFFDTTYMCCLHFPNHVMYLAASAERVAIALLMVLFLEASVINEVIRVILLCYSPFSSAQITLLLSVLLWMSFYTYAIRNSWIHFEC